jgi:hypothetical protein
MKQKMYVRPISVVLSISMFDQLKAITDESNIAISDYIREALQEKLANKKTTITIKQEKTNHEN